ncbi:hypothetical protein HZH68_016315 [Vespula germanica]|uniref:Uncharacterized protein n=1 Tax=Vespula germanica TaxID=30212 RepID=A0A834MPY6_VESGE|nr:hypothetical protein HZH68_016315 [Vespula germanica]
MSEQYVERLKPCQILEDIRENLDFYEEGIHQAICTYNIIICFIRVIFMLNDLYFFSFVLNISNARIHLSEGGWGRGWHRREFNWNAERFARARKSKHPFPPTAYSLAELTAGNQGNWVVPSMSMQGSQAMFCCGTPKGTTLLSTKVQHSIGLDE